MFYIGDYLSIKPECAKFYNNEYKDEWFIYLNRKMYLNRHIYLDNSLFIIKSGASRNRNYEKRPDGLF